MDEDFEENSRSKKLKTAMTDTADNKQVMCIIDPLIMFKS